jgi:hypothetical protein
MSRPIDADALLEHAWMLDHPDRFSEYVVSEDDINEAPTLDVVPVKYGRWVSPCINKYGHPCHHCSECGFKASQKDRNYCPNCGAKMT